MFEIIFLYRSMLNVDPPFLWYQARVMITTKLNLHILMVLHINIKALDSIYSSQEVIHSYTHVRL